MDLKNEVAGITFLVGVAAIFLLLTGVPRVFAGVLPLAVGSVIPPQFPSGGIQDTGYGMVGSGALRTTFGLVGLVAVWAAIESGYFEPDDERSQERTVDEPEPESETGPGVV